MRYVTLESNFAVVNSPRIITKSAHYLEEEEHEKNFPFIWEVVLYTQSHYFQFCYGSFDDVSNI